ncbi:MAG TPA: hypothetical protein VKP69_12295 [Isosphaeraceae bacterium]|nr:hypothetical protein [Isosphaeraceae bacterium]
MVRPDVPRLGRQDEADRDEADPRPRLGPHGTGQAVEAQAGHGERHDEQPRQRRRQAEHAARRVEQGERAAVRVEGVERADERVVGEERRILPVEQQGEPIRLVVVAAVIAAQGEIEAEDQDDDQPAGQDMG